MAETTRLPPGYEWGEFGRQVIDIVLAHPGHTITITDILRAMNLDPGRKQYRARVSDTVSQFRKRRSKLSRSILKVGKGAYRYDNGTAPAPAPAPAPVIESKSNVPEMWKPLGVLEDSVLQVGDDGSIWIAKRARLPSFE